MKTINNINKELLEIQVEIDFQNEKKISAQSNLSSIKTSMADRRMEDKLFKKYLEAKQVYIKDINDSIDVIKPLKRRRTELSNELYSLKTESDKNNSINIFTELQFLKDKYFEFYNDKTRIASMRNMAKDFIIDLESVIKNNK